MFRSRWQGPQRAGFRRMAHRRIPAMPTDYASSSAKAVRDAAEKGAAQVEKMTAAAGEVMNDTYAANMKGVQEYSAKMLEFANANTNAAMEFMRQLTTAKSPTEFFAMSSNHLRQGFETYTRQAQELASIAQKATMATTDTIKSGMNKRS
jgi:hypothetical protein